jgi:hypothetical protein
LHFLLGALQQNAQAQASRGNLKSLYTIFKTKGKKTTRNLKSLYTVFKPRRQKMTDNWGGKRSGAGRPKESRPRAVPTSVPIRVSRLHVHLLKEIDRVMLIDWPNAKVVPLVVELIERFRPDELPK